ncbi:MAG: helix-turn-helix transcriptional regulator [Anaerolineae bacterium]|nr:helix-turn-helix transcriptional regulator [Anaerolineae bacterium]
MRRRVPPIHFDGHRLRALRQQRGLRVEDVAAISGITARHIWRLEAGNRSRVAAVTLARIALALDTSVDYLLGLTDDPNPPNRAG